MLSPSTIQVGNLQLGWIGLGSMGLAMALNIQKNLQANSQPSLKYWNRTLSKGDPLKKITGEPSPSVGDLASSCGVIFICVSDDGTLDKVINEIEKLGSSLKGKIVVDTTTVHPSTTTSITTRLKAHGASYVAAPVFGSTPTAQIGQLLVAVAGEETAVSTIFPFLKGAIAREVIRVGEDPAQALLLKTTSNMLTAGMMYLISEAHTLAEKSGLPSSVLESLIEQNLGSYAHGVSKRLTSGVYVPAEGQAPQSGLELGIKDVQHGVDLARSNGMKLDVAESYVEAAKEAKEWNKKSDRVLDSSSVFGVVRQRAGLEFENEVVKERDSKTGGAGT
ncbi:uncharacterized protein EKO05_0001417 [Ascochyta rabiei]|uniref:Coenzyme binding n=1 Tax=Didymella rabiei TaxID=5454 RepID=A0A163AJU8_DIDRA|nr:uncharacterized protein EKO05_0001417 [Ascochyta rabiei]KZM21231.1 coenzyme binding [Ascochyta rabiei]UPX10778.1 hypothetical protein EKO05_0001417 [Ascochyta rabiei]